MVMEQLIEDMPREAQLRVRERKPKTAREAGGMADDYYLAKRAASGGDKRCYKGDRREHLAVECEVIREGFDRGAVESNRNPQNARQGNNNARASRKNQKETSEPLREVRHGNKTNCDTINVAVCVTMQLTVQISPKGLEVHP